MDPIMNQHFAPGQQDMIAGAMSALMRTLISIAPQLAPHLLSGGVLNIVTMSGANIKLGFEPQRGGLIIPGGIQPAKNGGLIP